MLNRGQVESPFCWAVSAKNCIVGLLVTLAISFNLNSIAGELPDLSILTEDAAVEVAVRDNPNLAQMKARFRALSEIPQQVGTLPDPTLNINAMNFPTDTFDTGQEAMTQLQLGFSQVFPFPGKLKLKRAAAEFAAQAAGYSADEVKLQLKQKVKTSWWQIYYMDRALETVSSNQDLLRQFITVARTKYETGQGLQQDVLLAQLELSKLLDQQIQLGAIRRILMIGLNILMDQPANNPLFLPVTSSKAMPNLLNESDLYLKAESLRPRLMQMATQVDAAESRLGLAKRDYYPDFMIGMTYGDRSGTNPLPRGDDRADFASLMVGIKVPLYAGRKQARAVSQRRIQVEEARYMVRDERSMVMAEISNAVTQYRRAREQFRLFESGIVPQAQQTVASMLAGYQVSEVDFLNLVRSQITLFNYQLQYWKALSDANQALAQLEAAVGEESVYEQI